MKFWPFERRRFLYIQVCVLAAVILWLAFAHLWLLKAVAIAAVMWVLLVFGYYPSRKFIDELVVVRSVSSTSSWDCSIYSSCGS